MPQRRPSHSKGCVRPPDQSLDSRVWPLSTCFQQHGQRHPAALPFTTAHLPQHTTSILAPSTHRTTTHACAHLQNWVLHLVGWQLALAGGGTKQQPNKCEDCTTQPQHFPQSAAALRQKCSFVIGAPSNNSSVSQAAYPGVRSTCANTSNTTLAHSWQQL